MRGKWLILSLFLVSSASYAKHLILNIHIDCGHVCFIKSQKPKPENILAPLPISIKNTVGLSFFFNRLDSLNSMIKNVQSMDLSKTYQEPSTQIYTEDVRRNANYYQNSVITKNIYIRPTNKGNELISLYNVSPQLDFGLALNKMFK